MSSIKLQPVFPSDVPTPSTGRALFFNVEEGNALYAKASNGDVTPIGSSGSGSRVKFAATYTLIDGSLYIEFPPGVLSDMDVIVATPQDIPPVGVLHVLNAYDDINPGISVSTGNTADHGLKVSIVVVEFTLPPNFVPPPGQ